MKKILIYVAIFAVVFFVARKIVTSRRGAALDPRFSPPDPVTDPNGRNALSIATAAGTGFQTLLDAFKN